MTSTRTWWVAVMLCGCGAASGPQANATYFWEIASSAVSFGACSDAPAFRQGVTPIAVEPNTFMVYKVSSDGKHGVTQNCTRLDPSTCSPMDGGVVFDIAGSELTYSETDKAPVGNQGCTLQQTFTWTLSDQTRTMKLDIANVLTLVDAPTACAKVESDLKRDSPNGLGIEGCVITSSLTGDLR